MPFNLIKTYNQLLEINHYNDAQKNTSLRNIFNRDIENNTALAFRTKIIRPLKADGIPAMDVLFDHLTKEATDIKDENGKTIKQRKYWENDRCHRLHWIKYHINETKADTLTIFSYVDRIKSKDVPRTYLYDKAEQYIVVLEPYRNASDYYLITAYYLTKAKGGIKQLEQKLKNKLDEIL